MARLFAAQEDTITVVITSSQNFIVPAWVNKLTVTGYGGRGQDGYWYTINAYTGGWARETVYRDGTSTSEFGQVPYTYGVAPQPYCYAEESSSGPIRRVTTCYSFTDESYSEYQDPTYGTAATAFSRNFPGSYGNTQQTETTFKDITVSPGSSHPIRPNGGRITISYTQ